MKKRARKSNKTAKGDYEGAKKDSSTDFDNDGEKYGDKDSSTDNENDSDKTNAKDRGAERKSMKRKARVMDEPNSKKLKKNLDMVQYICIFCFIFFSL